MSVLAEVPCELLCRIYEFLLLKLPCVKHVKHTEDLFMDFLLLVPLQN